MSFLHTKWVALLQNGFACDGDVMKFADVPREQVAAFAIVTDNAAVFIMEGKMPVVYRRRHEATASDAIETMHFLGMEDRIVGVSPDGKWRELPTFSYADWWSQPIAPINDAERAWMKQIQYPQIVLG